MNCVRMIEDDLYWIGSDDRRLKLFENIIPIQNGISYNSYILLDEKTVLFDTVDYSVGKRFLENLEFVLNGRKLDYLVINHMEPDHSSIIEEIILRYPEIKIIGNIQTHRMLKQFFSFEVDSRIQIVKENDELNTGKHTLKFLFAQMVHWPEVMFTYDMFSKIIFSADAFGTFGALNGNLYNDDTDYEKVYLNEARRYYSNIVGKYGIQVYNALKKIKDLEINKICPLHGPIWRENLKYIIEKYKIWSTYEPEDRSIVIIYSSVYGNTENVANILANKLGERQVKNIKVYDVSNTEVSELVSESFRCSNIAIISTTYNMGVFPPMEQLLHHLASKNYQNRKVGIIENGTWAPSAGKCMKDILNTMKDITICKNQITIKSAMNEQNIKEMENLAEEILK